MPTIFRAFFGGSPVHYPGEVRPFYAVGRPGFFGGFGSWLDMFSPQSWDYSVVPLDRVDGFDAAMLALDWQIVGMDMVSAIEKKQPIAA